ncbi:hypothetical protein PAAG_12348 [Paracoccidioides lutzii Pb01]|uniref:Amidohydrolase-related domain-containing protein n=1 Tax=Paracoccidioides lutzii (strain ATCC MYA-826 / Pb01) TaxID=502779 RepID=A0A0A2V490_PARBA|nr:hypothetical protein PAAG_12348 [Paracoccidioides lutzii Pb01]KGQ00975.1 hypothetical protein PAAG_12348 [Paracoccidioides lutzii Pb01]
MAYPIIDAWANPAFPIEEDMPEVQRLFEQSGADKKLLEKRRTPDELVALMDAAGVSQICICAWYRPGHAVFSNAEVATFTRAYPDRFIGIAGVDLLDPVCAVKELDHYVKKEGFKGLRVVPWLWALPPTDAHYWPLYVKCVELDIPFHTQVGHTGPLCPSEVGRPIPYIDEIALKFPTLSIICGHIGYPWTAEMISVAWKHPNVYIDTSAHLPAYYPKELIQFANTTGRKKVMFGTNFPQLSWKQCVESAHKDLKLREEAKADFFGGNAARVLKLGQGMNATKGKL